MRIPDDGQWNWWRIYLIVMPAVVLTALFIGIDKLESWATAIGGAMAYIIGRASQQSADKRSPKGNEASK